MMRDLLPGPAPPPVQIVGQGALPSVFPVTELAAESVATAVAALAGLVAARHGHAPTATVDRRLASIWFRSSIRPQGWTLPPDRDPLAGDYQTADGWIRLHTNAPHHRAAALRALGVAGERDAVERAVRTWPADALEAAVLEAGGCAATMRDLAAWHSHPQGAAVAQEPLLHVATGEQAPPPDWPVPPHRPLQGIRVLDMTRVLAGPVSTRFLAGFGAEVLRIDPPSWNEPGVAPDVTLGKRCARLDLRDPAARAHWETLLRGADVLVHGYRPGALPGLGLDPATRQALRPGLVDVSLCAYGWTGPWATRRGFDSLVQMSGGIADAGMRRQNRDRPTPLPVQALDHATGYLLAAAVLRGLETRLRTGAGIIARASLARTAALLTTMAPGDTTTATTPDTTPLAPETQADLADWEEPTPWGPARRIHPPCHIEGAPMHWDLPASPLGTATPDWKH